MSELALLGCTGAGFLAGAASIFAARLRAPAERLVALGITTLALWFFLAARQLPTYGETPSSATVPALWAMALAITGSALFVWPSGTFSARTPIGKPLVVIALLVATITAVPLLGFYLASSLLLVICLVLFGETHPLHLTSVLLVWNSLLYILFARVLEIPLPTGSLIVFT